MSRILLNLGATYVMLTIIRDLISSLVDEFIRYNHLNDDLIDQCDEIESQISLWIDDILKIKPELG